MSNIKTNHHFLQYNRSCKKSAYSPTYKHVPWMLYLGYLLTFLRREWIGIRAHHKASSQESWSWKIRESPQFLRIFETRYWYFKSLKCRDLETSIVIFSPDYTWIWQHCKLELSIVYYSTKRSPCFLRAHYKN